METNSTNSSTLILSTPILKSKCFKYAEDVATGQIIACKKNILGCKRFLNDLERQKYSDFRWRFDIEKAYRPIDFKERFMVPIKGDRERMDLLPWQHYTTGNIYGWVDKKTSLRRFREVLEIVARGNGKTTDLAGNALYAASKDGERGADAFLLANAKEQSKILFNEVSNNVTLNRVLGKHFRVTVAAIYYDKTNSKIQHRASDSRKLDGLNPHLAIFDEIHEFRDFKLINVIKRPMKKRRQPLVIYITSLGNQLDGPLMRLYELAEDILTTPEAIRESVRDRFFTFICEIDDASEIEKPECWIKANPSLGELLSIEDLIEEWERVRLVPDEKSDFINKQLNVFTNIDELSFLDYETIKKNSGVLDTELLRGRDCYAGYDASTSEDFTAAHLEFPLDDGSCFMMSHSWIPEKKVRQNNEKLDFHSLREQGCLTIIPGDYIKAEYVRNWFLEKSKIYNIRSGGYDPAYSYGIVEDLRMEGIRFEAVRQGALTQADPLKNLKERYLDGKVISNNDPMLSWYVNNVKLVLDRNGNRVPSKQNRFRKIDGFAAMLNAHTEYMRQNPTSQPYTGDVVTVISLE